MATRLINQSDLSSDPEIANFIFESASVDEQADPLNILMQREAEGDYLFAAVGDYCPVFN